MSKEHPKSKRKILPPSPELETLTIDPDIFESTVKRSTHDHLNELPRKRRRRKRTSFIKVKGTDIQSEMKSGSRKLLGLKLPNGIEIEFWS